MSKSSIIPTADASDKRQQRTTTPSTSTTVAVDTTPLNIQTKPKTTIQAPIHAPTVTTTKNINQAEIQEETQVENESHRRKEHQEAWLNHASDEADVGITSSV
ncbi:hypothetical protein Tco_1349064 [Tanacetum coccineum]